MKNIDKMSALLEMIEMRSTDMVLTHDVLNDYTEEQLSLVFEVMDTIIDFGEGDAILDPCVKGCRCRCRKEACTIDIYGKVLNRVR